MAWRIFLMCGTAFWGHPIFAQPTGNVLLNVHQIRFGNTMGTAFVVDYAAKQYFVTARHVVAKAGEKATVEMRAPGASEWKRFAVTVLKGKSPCADVAALVPTEARVSNAEPIPYPYNFALGQEVYFLGFPYGLYTSFGKEGGMGVALIKHAYLSARASCSMLDPSWSKDEKMLLLDGLNNPGFSGGPVVAPDMFSPITNKIRQQKLIGVISGYRNQAQPIIIDGKSSSNAVVQTNTGIILAVPIEAAIALIRDFVSSPK